MKAIELMQFQQHKPVQLCHLVSNMCSYMLSCVRGCATWIALQQGMLTALVTIHNSKNPVWHIIC